jgi:hypothetical protein
MSIIRKFGDNLQKNLNTYQTFVDDTAPNSEYFRITEFKETFTGGKNGFLIEGSQYLQQGTEIKIQILDVNGDPIYYEPASGTPEYYEGISTLIAVYVYEDTPIGLANITILGELKKYIDEDGIERDIPDEWKGVYNVKWESNFKVNRLIRNEDRVRFYRRPQVNIDEIVKPIFSNVVSVLTKSGSLNGIPQTPIEGTNLTNYRLPTSYLLRLNDGSAWTGSVVGSTISIPELNYTPQAAEVLNNTDLIVTNPHTVGNIVTSFLSASFTASFNYVEGVDNLATALTGSFAKIKISELTTFVGDVARVKVYRKSQSDLSDYQFIQEIQLESNEVLIDLESQTKNQEFYGLFDSNIITEYWLTSSNNITPSFNQSILFNSVKLTNNGTNFYFTSKSLDITKDIEYTLDLNLRRESVQSDEYLKVFLSGSRESSVNGSPTTIQIQQNILNISANNSTLQKTNSSTNFVAEEIDNAKLYFEVNGGPWYVSDVSVRASQESSFSPDELTFIQPVPRTLPAETFDFLFQFYDINNNYIPVVIEESKTFNGGNLNAINKSIELIPSSLYFQFDSGSNGGNPVPPTTIFIDVVKNFLTGSTNFTSRSFDFFNNELSSSQYVGGVFPGLLEDFNLDTVKLTVEAFTGSVAPPNPDIIVQFIQYTAECEGVEDSIIITRVQDGKGGVNYEIRAYNGTVIRNSDISSSLEIQAIRIDGVNEIKLRSGLEDNRSDYQLFVQSGSTYVTLQEASDSGFVKGLSAGTTGSGELNYNAQFNRDSIDIQRTVYLIPSSSTNLSASIVTALTLTDLQDGLDAGVVLFDAEAFTINPRTQTQFTPPFSSATASFYRRGTFEAPISCSFEVYPSMSINADFVPEYWMYFITHSCDVDISVVAYDEAGNIVPSLPLNSYIGSPLTQSKQLLTSFTYTEPFTSASVNVDKLFSIIPEGKPGDESVVFEIVPSNVNLKSDSRGFVADFNSSITDIQLKQGSRYLIFTASREPGTFHIAQSSIVGRNLTPGNVYFDVNYTSSLIVSASSNMTDLSGSVEYPLEIQPYYTSSVYTASVFQQFTKILDGPPPIELIFSPQNVILQADEVGFVSDYSAANTDIQVKEGDDFLTFTTQSNLPGSWRILSVNTNNIQSGVLSSSSYDNATLTFDRFDYPYISASAVYNIRVNPFSLGPGHQHTSSIYTRTQSFSKNVAPPAARGVSLTTTAQTVTFDGDGVVLAPLGDINLTATAVNTTGSIFYQFYKDGSPYSAIQSDNFFDISSGDAVNPGEISTWMVEIRDGSSSPSAPVRAKSEITISGIKAGSEAYTIVLANENSSISADLWDVNFTGSNNTISAFKGTQQLIHTNSFSPETLDLQGNPIGSLGEYQVTIFSTSSFITPGSGLGSGSILTTIGSSAFIGDLGGWTTPGLNQSGEIVYKIDIENGRQTFFKTQSFGVNIEPAAPYVVELSNQNTSVVYKVSGQLTVDGTGTIVRAFRGGSELNNASSSFSTPQTDIYGNTGYKNQYRVTVNSVSAYIDLAGAIVSGSALLSNPAQIGNIDSWTSPDTNLTGEVVYRIELEGRQTILKPQNFGVQLEGNTGPGIVMRGQWNEVTNYIGSVETTNNRRDSVIYPDPSGSNGETHYFMALSGSGPATTAGPQVPPAPSNDTDYWQYLGQQDFFVSAKLAIFEESFVKNTINVGNNPGSSFANIVIAGGRTDPYLAIGQGGTQGATGTSGFSVTGSNILGYNQPGIFLGMYENGGAGTTGRFSIKSAGGTAGTRGLFWDGDVLTIVGAIRQVQPGQNEGGLRGVWSSGLIYYPDDIVTYQDQSWVMTGATHTSTNDTNVLTGVPGSGPWTVAAAAGTSGADGTSGTGGVAKTVVLGAETYVITYDADGTNPTPASTIKLEASSSGFTDAYFKFTGGGTNFTDEATYTDGEGPNTDSASLSVPSTFFTTPLTMRVGVADGDQTELTSDTITIFAVKPGADVSPQFMITPLTGTQLKNKQGSITLQVQQSDSTGLTDVTSGTGARLFKNDSSLLATTMSGITDGGNGVVYNPTIDSSVILGSLVLELRDVSDNVLDTITLVDVSDGLGGGSFLASALNTNRQTNNTYLPTFLSATASFFDVNQSEYKRAWRIVPNFDSNTDFMYYDDSGDINDSEITFTINDGDGTNYSGDGIGNKLPTKDLNIVATFTDPQTGAINTITETFYIVSDGADGIDAITVISTNQAHTVPASNAGVVSSYLGSGTTISVFEGTGSLSYDGVGTSAGSWTVSSSINPTAAITIGSITDTGDTATIADHSGMDNSEDVVTITYTILGKRFANTPFTASSAQTITKAKTGDDGTSGTAGTAGGAGSPGAGVVYRGEFAGTTGYFHTTTRRDVVRYAANYFLTSNVGLNSSAGTDWGTPGASTSWESFGAQFSSVATDILLAQDVYADRTVNIGADGPNPVIALNADYPTNANPSIKINLGTQGFSGTNGIFIGFDSSIPKLSLVNASNTKYVKWSGSDLEVKGTINADAGVIGGFAITQNAISSSNNKLILRNNGEITGSAINLLSGSLAGWSVDPSGIFYKESVITGYQTVSSSTIIANSAVFPSELVGNPYGQVSTIEIPSTGTVYNVTSRPSTTTLTINTLIYRTPSSFKLIYSSGSFVGPNLTDGTLPGTWRDDYVNELDPASSETWDVKWEINTASGSTYTLGDNSYSPGYSLIKVTGGSLDSYFELSDADINKLIVENVIRREPEPFLYDSGINYPVLTIRDSYDVNNPSNGPFLDGPAFRARSFRVVDIINESNPTSTSGYNTFVLGLELGGSIPFEEYFEAFESNYGISELKENQEWDNIGGGGQPSVFNTIQLQLFDSVTKTSTTDFGGATVTAGFLSATSASIEAVRLASSGSNNSNKPYLSMGQITQSFDETGIFIGYSSGSSQERMSLKSSNGQKFFKWTGTDVEVKGTVRADSGVIGGFIIGTSSISDINNNLILTSDGHLTGSGVLLATEVDSVEYVILDTTNGIIDAKNNGRHIYFDPNETTIARSGGNGTTFGTPTTVVWQGLTYESRLNVALQAKVEKSGSCRGIGGVRATLYASTSGSSGTSGTSYDNWVELRQKSIASVGNLGEASNYTASLSQIGPDSVSNEGRYFQIDDYVETLISYNHKQYQSNLLKLVIEPFVQTSIYTNGGAKTYLKNISVTTGRGLASTFDKISEAPSFPTPPEL